MLIVRNFYPLPQKNGAGLTNPAPSNPAIVGWLMFNEGYPAVIQTYYLTQGIFSAVAPISGGAE